MRAAVLSGRTLNAILLDRIKQEITRLRRPPSLAVLIVGGRPDSLRYVAAKQRAAEACGIRFHLIKLPETVSQNLLYNELQRVSADDAFDGVLLQLPLPAHISAPGAILCIRPSKDVDGLHPMNLGNLFLHENPIYEETIQKCDSRNSDETLSSQLESEGPYFIPCTALAIHALLFSYLAKTTSPSQTPVMQRKKMHAVIINKSMVVGIPTAALLQKEENFMVTLCSRSNELERVKRISCQADVLVTAIGIPRVVTAEFVKPGAIVVDVAINENKACKVKTQCGRYPVCGDVEVESVGEKAAALTSVPGGVGPLTVAYLMQNTLKAFLLSEKKINTLSGF